MVTPWSDFYDDRRAAWKAAKPSSKLTSVNLAARHYFFTHWVGAGKLALETKPHSACLAQVKAWQKFHMGPGRNWADIGYNALICPHGRCIEGRGLQYRGSHCPDYNTSGVGVQFMVGKKDVVTQAAYARMRKLRDQLDAQPGVTLKLRGHRDGTSTECPGDTIHKWTKAGMPVKAGTDTPAVKPKPTPTPPGKVEEDGFLGPKTIKAWQKEMGTPVDGIISRPSTLVKKVQAHLVAKSVEDAEGQRLRVDGLGIGSNNDGRYPVEGNTDTIEALQKYLKMPTVDGYLSSPSNTIKALQKKLNAGTF